MAKRSSTNHCFVVGVDKPAGLSSHDVVNRLRRIYGERRCGHMGTLDPAATGALALCVGPATRLDALLTGHDKSYEFSIVFGASTSTDDAEGEVLRRLPVPECCYSTAFAKDYLTGQLGPKKQLPPVYSAIKVDGKRSYAQARAGKVIDLAPRDVQIYSMELLGIDQVCGLPCWRVAASVSAGTYVRSIARDAGLDAGTCAHVGSLRRTQAGNLRVQDCVSLEELQESPFDALLDPVKLLGLRVLFCNEEQAAAVEVGRVLPARQLRLCRYLPAAAQSQHDCACTSGLLPAPVALAPGECVSVVVGNRLKAIYEYDAARRVLKSRCGFAVGVQRGADI